MSRRRIDPERERSTPPAAAAGEPTPRAPRRSAGQAVLVYTAGRIVAFLVSLGVLRLLGFTTYALFLGALVLSALLSLVLLRRQRAAVSESLATRPRRDALTRRSSGRPGGTASGDTGEAADGDAYDPYADDGEDDEAGSGADSGDTSGRSARPRP